MIENPTSPSTARLRTDGTLAPAALIGYVGQGEERDRVMVVRMASLVAFLAIVVVGLYVAVEGWFTDKWFGLVLAGLAAIAAVLARRDSVRSAVAWLFWGCWISSAIWAFRVSGIQTPVLHIAAPLLFMTGIFLGRSYTLLACGVVVLTEAFLWVGESYGWLPPPTVRDSSVYFYAMWPVAVVVTYLGNFVGEELKRRGDVIAAIEAELRGRDSRILSAERRFASLIAIAPWPILVTDVLDLRIVETNASWQAEFGWAPGEAVGKTIWELGQLRRPLGSSESTGAAGVDPMSEEFASMRHRDGRIERYRLHSTLIPDGERTLRLTFLVPVRMTAEAPEAVTSKELEMRVSERTAELEQMVKTLKDTQEELVHSEKLASLGMLVAGISHEIKTPIGNTIVLSTALQDRVREIRSTLEAGELTKSSFGDFLKAVADMSSLLERSSRRASDLVTSFKQVAVDQTSERRRFFDLKEVIDDVVATLRPTFKHQPWIFEVDVPAGIECDSYPGPLGQVVTNLIQNACIHGFDGRRRGTVRISAGVGEAQTVRVLVADDGAGMTSATIARIFDPFFTTRLGHGGSGLGLTITYRIVTAILGGTISVESKPDQGSRFMIEFPARAPSASRPGY